MKKEIVFIIPALAIAFLISIIPIVSSLSIENTQVSNTAGYNIFINNSMSADKLESTSTEINLYHLTTAGTFTNLNTASNSEINFFGLTTPINDIVWGDDLSVIARDIGTDFNFAITALRYIIVGDYPAEGGGETEPYSPGGGSSSGTTINLANITLSSGKWLRNETNKLYVKTLNVQGEKVDVSSITISSLEKFTYDLKRNSIGDYVFSINMTENVSEATFFVQATDQSKVVKESITIQIQEKNVIDNITSKMSVLPESIDNIGRSILDSPLYLSISIAMVMMFVFTLIMLHARRKRNKKA